MYVDSLSRANPLDDPLPSMDINDDEPVVTAEMLKARELQQAEREKKRKEETTLIGQKGQKEVDNEGKIAVKDINSQFIISQHS
jgi:hypothetical protein